jgi:hypothetical protein
MAKMIRVTVQIMDDTYGLLAYSSEYEGLEREYTLTQRLDKLFKRAKDRAIGQLENQL